MVSPAALALSVDDSLSSEEFTDLLISTAEDLGADGKDNSYGYGLINPALLLATISEDTESLILSNWDGGTGVSAYIASLDAINLIAFYDESGRMISVKSEERLCNFNLPANTKQLALFAIDAASFIPIQIARKAT